MGAFGISQPVRRTEDPIFLTGQGRYVDDIKLDDTLHAFVLRSPHAHANINSIDISRADAAPGLAGHAGLGKTHVREQIVIDKTIEHDLDLVPGVLMLGELGDKLFVRMLATRQ